MSRKFRKLILVVIPVTALVLLSYFVFGTQSKPVAKITQRSIHKTAAVALAAHVINHGLPAQLEIPKLSIDANVLYMGLTPAGAMDVPPNIIDVGWYKYGALPGDRGTAVIAGHLDGPQGQPGVFADLDKLGVGDRMSIIDMEGRTTSFTVQQTQTYGQDEQPSTVFSSSDGTARLNLITCTGPWDSAQHLYTERLVVFAVASS